MNALVINCSPVSNGATAEIVHIVSECLKSKYDVKSICIDDFKVGFCKGCRSCHSTAKCIQHDDVDLIIIRMDDDTVTFSVKDYRNEGQWKELTIPGVEFIRRFLMHVPPNALCASAIMVFYVPVLKTRSWLFAEISSGAKSTFQNFATWKCLKYWDIFMASKSVCAKPVADILANPRCEYRCVVKG